MEQVKFRAAELGDVEEIVEILRGSRIQFLPYALPAHSELDDKDWVKNTLIPSTNVSVAHRDNKILGVLAVNYNDSIIWIEQLYVHPNYCGQGIGSQLLKSVIKNAIKPIRLYTFQENRRSREFYERFGFRAIEFGDGSDNEEKCPDVLYELHPN